MGPDVARLYFDHNATSPLRPEAEAAIQGVLGSRAGNPSSLHAEGRAARAVVERARESVAALCEARPAEVVFTSGGSEALSAALRGVCDRAPAELRRIVVSEIEHSAVLDAARAASRRGFQLSSVPCDRDGRVVASRFVEELGPDVVLAALQWANNETGVLQPVEEVARAARKRGIPFLVDAVQAAGKTSLSGQGAIADFLAISAHKLGGPQGVGALVVREGIVLAPLVAGGAQERRRRGGTPPVALIAGFGAAAAAARLGLREEADRLLRLRARLEARLRESHDGLRIHGQGAPRLPNTVNFSVPGVSGEILTIALDLAGVAVSTGSACASGAVEPSHVIRAMGFDEAEARGAVRVSLGWSTLARDLDLLLERLPAVVRRVQDGLAVS